MDSARMIMLNATTAPTSRNVFLNGEYLRRVPQWHADDSAWKASGILRMLELNDLSPRSIGEVGCGTGEVLRQLQLKMAPDCVFSGYDIAPQAIELSRTRENDRLHCRLGDIRKDPIAHFDLLLVLDVLEHQENYFSFLRDVKPLAPYKIFHTVLDLSVKAVLRSNGLMELRRTSDDLHFFSKDTMLQALRAEGYRIIHWFYAPRAIYRASGVAKRIRQWPRAVCFALNQDFAVRVLGGYSLFVLAQ
jgi:SAM-dependent methyltransferase